MSEKFCENLNTCLTFHKLGATFCNRLNSKGKINFFPYEKNFLDNFLIERENLLKNLKQGIIPDYCNDCSYMQDIESNHPDENKIKKLEIYHWDECNCACFYCSNRHVTKLKTTNKRNVKGAIEIHKILEELHKRNLLSDDLDICTVGGEPTLLKEYPKILKFTQKNKYKINMLSNGIIYEKEIAKTLKNIPSILCISLDCGKRETFLKIKGVDKFNEVIKNISRYIKEAKQNYKGVMLKYIIIENVNDNKDEIDTFLKICNEIGVRNIMPSIDFCHGGDRGNNSIPDHICDLYKYIKTKAKELNEDMTLSTYEFVERMIEAKSFKV